MKTNPFFLAIAALATICVASCSNDEAQNQAESSDGMIRLSSAIAQTSSTGESLQNTQFAAGAKIGLFVTDNAASPAALYTNRELTADGSGALAVKTNENMYYASNDRVNLYAYYPYQSVADIDTLLPFCVMADQSSISYYQASDLMWGVPVMTNPVKRTTSVVKIGFAHKLAKVIVKLTSGAGSPDLKGATVTILNTLPSTTFNIKTGEIAAASGTATPIKMATFADNATSFECSAVVVPQVVLAPNQLIEVLLADGGKLYYNVPAGGIGYTSGKLYNKIPTGRITFASGKSYIYNVTVNLTELIVSTQITDWAEGNGTGQNGNATMPDVYSYDE